MPTSTKNRFSHRAIYRHRQPHAFYYASRRYSFWVATFALFAFVVGNMVGQHGWYAFWHSVMGKNDDSAIVFTGTVTPIDKVPDHARWAAYGGNSAEHTYRMVPDHLLISLPRYEGVSPRLAGDTKYVPFSSVYSVGHLGDYITGADNHGSHVGIDIRVPIGTPVRSIANGIVDMTKSLTVGYGKHVVVRHPNVPDPDRPGNTTTMYSVYAHLDAIIVTEGMLVQKGQQIGTAGQTGLASGPHLHFQIDKESAPFHPYWPFTSGEASAAGMTFTQAVNAGLGQELGRMHTVNPMRFVQDHLGYAPPAGGSVQPVATHRNDPAQLRELTAAERALARREMRMGDLPTPLPVAVDTVAIQHPSAPATPPVTHSISSQPAASVPPPTTSSSASSIQSDPVPHTPVSSAVTSIGIRHNGQYNRSWEKVHITAYDADGNVVHTPDFTGTIYLRVAFGEGEIRPETLTAKDFVSGTATVNVLPRGSRRSFVLETKGAFETIAEPMRHVR